MSHRGASPGLLRHNNQPKMESDINYAQCNNNSTLSDFLFSSGQIVSTENTMAVLCRHNQLQRLNVWNYLMEAVSNLPKMRTM